MTSEDTRITYVTVGVLLRQLVINKHMRNYTHVIVDEVCFVSLMMYSEPSEWVVKLDIRKAIYNYYDSYHP